MRRIAAARTALALAAPAVLALGVVTAGPAQAAQINGGILTSGHAYTATVSHAGDTVAYQFAATKNWHTDVDVTRTNWGANGGAALRWYRPDGSFFDQCIVTTAAKICDITPDAGGTWTMAVEPGDAAVGSATFTFANDMSAGALKADTPLATKFTIPGQGLTGTFTAAVDNSVSIDTTAFSLGSGGTARISFYEPDGSLFDFYCILNSTSPDPCSITPDQAGPMLVQIQPTDSDLGTATFTYAPDQQKGLLTAGTPVTTTLPSINENAYYSFKATAGVPVSFPISAASWGSTGAAYLYFFPSVGGPLFTHCVVVTTTACQFTPNSTGTWSAELDPQGATVGSTTFSYVPDQVGGALTAGKAVTTTIKTAGQNADFTFAAVTGTHVTFDVSATNWGTGGSAQLKFYSNTGVYALACTITATPTFCDLTPNSTGSWQLVLDPQGSATGAATITYAPDENKGLITRSTAVTTAIASRGQNAEYTIGATAGVPITLKVTAASWLNNGAAGTARLYVFPPSGSPLFTNCTVSTAPTTCSFTPNTTGTWNLQLDPQASSTGSLTFTES